MLQVLEKGVCMVIWSFEPLVPRNCEYQWNVLPSLGTYVVCSVSFTAWIMHAPILEIVFLMHTNTLTVPAGVWGGTHSYYSMSQRSKVTSVTPFDSLYDTSLHIVYYTNVGFQVTITTYLCNL